MAFKFRKSDWNYFQFAEVSLVPSLRDGLGSVNRHGIESHSCVGAEGLDLYPTKECLGT